MFRGMKQQAEDHKAVLSSKSLSKESSVANPSVRVYYGGNSGSVPFTWESRPGTPKHRLSDYLNLDTAITNSTNSMNDPPLTPPPSYQHASSNSKVSIFTKLSNSKEDRISTPTAANNSAAPCPSVRVYYGSISGAIPFTWESQPGTPKHPLFDNSTPPLTPPPSYYSRLNNKPTKKKYRFNLDVLQRLFTKFSNVKKIDVSSSPVIPPSSSKSSSNYSLSSSSSNSSIFIPVTATPTRHIRHRRRSQFSSGSSSYDLKEYNYDIHDQEDGNTKGNSPNSTPCFSNCRVSSTSKIKISCYKS